MSHLSNPLVTTAQLAKRSRNSLLPSELQDCVLYHTARLTQAAGLLLRLPQDVTAQAIVILFRHWTGYDMMRYEFSDTSAAAIYLIAKISASPRSLRSITNVYAYLLSTSPLSPTYDPSTKEDPEAYYLSESAYIAFRNRILAIEGQILNATGFNVHIALPHPLAITYLQALDVFSAASNVPPKQASATAKRAVQHLNTALLSPQLLYLTHQPNALAVAAIYVAARETGVALPESEWWEVFDCEREELGFLVVGMRSLEGWVAAQKGEWVQRGWITREDVTRELGVVGDERVVDEEDEMMRMMDGRGS